MRQGFTTRPPQHFGSQTCTHVQFFNELFGGRLARWYVPCLHSKRGTTTNDTPVQPLATPSNQGTYHGRGKLSNGGHEERLKGRDLRFRLPVQQRAQQRISAEVVALEHCGATPTYRFECNGFWRGLIAECVQKLEQLRFLHLRDADKRRSQQHLCRSNKLHKQRLHTASSPTQCHQITRLDKRTLANSHRSRALTASKHSNRLFTSADTQAICVKQKRGDRKCEACEGIDTKASSPRT